MKWLRRKDNQQSTISIEQKRAETLGVLGAQLGVSRQAQGLSLDDVVVLTKIPRRLLQAIEEGNLEDLPEPIYIQGLIRQFADALGLNGIDLSSSFPIGSQKVVIQSTGPIKPVGQLRPLHLYLLYVFLVMFSVNGLSNLLNNATLQANNNRIQPVPFRESVFTSPQNQAVVSPVSSELTDDKNSQAVQIGVILKSSSWIRVVADGKTEFEGILPEGTHRTWKATEQLTVKTNNAGGVLMSVNQQEAKQMGEPGKVEEVRIAAKPKS